jgi:hypothetical protein
MRTLFLCVLVLGCGSPMEDPDAGPLPDTFVPMPECAIDADCEDGLFCTGVESCVAGRCESERVVCDDGIECTNDYCSEERGRCESDPPDADGDGFGDIACLDDRGDPLGDDCDDTNAGRFPGNRESCDLDDEDCDLETRGGTDEDSDGFESAACCNEEIVAGTPNCGDDCDDARGAVNPLGTEVCDGLDQDCDGIADDGVSLMGYVDMDLDGRGDDTRPMIEACPGARMFALEGGDCDDTNFAISPDQPEICDGIRNDCSGMPADLNAVSVDWYGDSDGDGFGSAATSVRRSCAPIPNASLSRTDCDDTRAAINPAAAEICDGLDNDCRNGADYTVGLNDTEDDDGDGYLDLACGMPDGDCNDRDPTSGPGEIERCDLRDNDCDSIIDEGAVELVYYRDLDGDGYGSAASGTIIACMASAGFVALGGDCNDTNPRRGPGARELCNLADDDCDATVDETADDECSRPGIEDQNSSEAAGAVPDGTWFVNDESDSAANAFLEQTFTIGIPGQLIGIEVEFHRTDVATDPRFYATLEVLDPMGNIVATRRFADSSVPLNRVPIGIGINGPTYVDLSAAALMVDAGQVWTWRLRTTGRGSCTGSPGMCDTRDRSFCFSGYECTTRYGVPGTSYDSYPGGAGALTPANLLRESFFRTVVRPSTPTGAP